MCLEIKTRNKEQAVNFMNEFFKFLFLLISHRMCMLIDHRQDMCVESISRKVKMISIENSFSHKVFRDKQSKITRI